MANSLMGMTCHLIPVAPKVYKREDVVVTQEDCNLSSSHDPNESQCACLMSLRSIGFIPDEIQGIGEVQDN